MRPSSNRYSWPLLAIVAGVLLIGLYALVREPAAIGLGVVLLAGYGLTGGGLIALVITFVERGRQGPCSRPGASARRRYCDGDVRRPRRTPGGADLVVSATQRTVRSPTDTGTAARSG